MRVQGLTPDDGTVEAFFDPAELHGGAPPPLQRPACLAIVASVDLAVALAGLPDPPDGFIVEAPSAGGHNAPPRGPRRTDERDQPIYDERDDVDLARMRDIGLPFWLAGSYGTPEGLRHARSEGAVGAQVGTAFAFCQESGLMADL